jgi:predicted NAD-dependent protein-ADP-ribosyltransferase YbiA (DUF1768 family)
MGGPAKIDGKIHKECDEFTLQSFIIDGFKYPSVVHYFQSQKTFIVEERDMVLSKKNPIDAWIIGNRVTLRPDWEKVKVNINYQGHKARFEQNPEIIKSLCSTIGPIIIEASN